MKDKNTYPNDLGFKVPDGFFENLEDQLMDQASLKSQLPNDTGFEVPDGYFDTLTDELLTTEVDIKEETPVRNLNWWYPALAVAAGLAVLFSLNIFDTTTETVDFAQLETAELEVFFSNQSDFEQDESLELLYAYEPELLEEVSIREELPEEELYNYLLEDIDINEIIIE